MKKELSPEEIVFQCKLNFTEERENKHLIPEYEEVYIRIKNALNIDKSGYNVYLIDDITEDKLNNLMDFIRNEMANKHKLCDICFVVGRDEKTPKVLYTSAGKGKTLKSAIKKLQEEYYDCCYDFYNNSELAEKEHILDSLQKVRGELINKLTVMSEKEGFDVKPSSMGFSFIPIKDGSSMTEKEYENLKNDEKDDILSRVGRLKALAQEILSRLKGEELQQLNKLKDIMSEHLKNEMEQIKVEVYADFSQDEEVVKYLNGICSSIEDELVDNYSINFDDDEDSIQNIIYKYEINILMDNEACTDAPVIYQEDPSLCKLLGTIEYESKNGNYITDINLIKAGSLIKANGGCLILKASDVVSNQGAYYQLKKCLLNNKVELDYNRNYLDMLSISGLKPEAVKISEKVILIGDYETYDILYNYDEDFKKIFSIKAESRAIIEATDHNRKALMDSINTICMKNNLRGLSSEAVREIFKYLSRRAEHRKKFNFDNGELNRLLLMSNREAISHGEEKINALHVRNVVYEEDEVERELFEAYKENKMLIKVKGSSIGQINALSIIDAGYFRFGKPLRITCTCCSGEGNIIDVQKESNLSGNIHNKAVNILRGFLSTLIGSYNKLPVDFHLSFEQLYGRIDGDSASVAEVVCMISSLIRIPIRQNIAVTGSVNQFGEIQPIGGVNEKIEGFYKACKLIKDVENKGVLIPLSNVEDLILKEELEREAEKGNFHIYTMKNIEDAFQTLFDRESINMKEVQELISREIRKYNRKNQS